MKLPLILGGAWLGLHVEVSSSTPHELEGQRLEAQQLLAQGANLLAEVQKEQEKRLLEMMQEVASMRAEQEIVRSRASQKAKAVKGELVCCFGLLCAPYGHCFSGHCLCGWHCLSAGPWCKQCWRDLGARRERTGQVRG